MNEIYQLLYETLENNNDPIKNRIRQLNFRAKTILLHEGEMAQYLYIINKGCLRLWFNNDGTDITVQFFVEDQVVSSFESFYHDVPSILNIETLEETKLTMIRKDDFFAITKKYPQFQARILDVVSSRLSDYMNLFLSRIKNSPEKRYLEFVENYQHIANRVPHHYIASYLGITPVSLSRIRKRIVSNINNS